MKSNINIVFSLGKREQGLRCNLRCNFKIMTHLVTSVDTHFTKVWEKRSNKPIHYESGKLYFDNYRTCYSICGRGGLPCILYQLPPCPNIQKIEEGVLCQGPVDLTEVPAGSNSHRGSFLALTADNWLVRYDLTTGHILQRVYLSTRHKFRHIGWDSEEYTVVVRSTHSKMSTLARQAGISQTLLMSLAVFTVFPLDFVAMMEVNKNIFGDDITDAMVSQGVLIVMHQASLVKLYSWQHIIHMGRTHVTSLYSTSPDGSTIGSYPAGIPLNINLKECPPVLFQVKCADHNMSLGGTPWHYIITPPGGRGYFRTYHLDTGQLADGGCLEMDTESFEPDKCWFHSDDSGRIIHAGSRHLQVHKIVEKCSNHVSGGLGKFELQRVYTIQPFNDIVSTPVISIPSYSSSGRAIKRSTPYIDDMLDDSSENLCTVDYENDLDLLYVTAVHQGQQGLEGKVHLHDNHTGRLIKTITLEEKWEPFNDHVISLDLDTLVHIVQLPMRKFTCHVYRLQRVEQTDLTPGGNPRRSRRAVIEQRLLQESTRDTSYRRSGRVRNIVDYHEDWT